VKVFPNVRAPGKLFLVGEYGVLTGGTAVVAAVDRFVTGQFVENATAASALVAEATRLARSHLDAEWGTGWAGLPDGAPVIDSAALAAEGRKLGLGSSAAAAAVAVGATFAAAGADVPRDRPTLFVLAERAHRAAQGGRGSGADVAAAVFGGVIAYGRTAAAAPKIQPLAPAPVEIIVFTAGDPRATPDAVRSVEALAVRDPQRHALRMSELHRAADGFVRGWELRDGPAVVDAARAAGLTLAALGDDAALEIWTAPVRAAAALAEELGGTAKPSGAGGGDVGVAFLTDRAACEAFRQRAPHLGLEVLNIGTAAPGLAVQQERDTKAS
jgi:phosphomevalonate kinase